MVAAESALVTLCSLYGGSGKCAGYFMVAVESVLVASHSLYGGSGKCAGYFMVTTLG